MARGRRSTRWKTVSTATGTRNPTGPLISVATALAAAPQRSHRRHGKVGPFLRAVPGEDRRGGEERQGHVEDDQAREGDYKGCRGQDNHGQRGRPFPVHASTECEHHHGEQGRAQRGRQARGGLAPPEESERQGDRAEVEGRLVEVGNRVVGRHDPRASLGHLPRDLGVPPLIGVDQWKVTESSEKQDRHQEKCRPGQRMGPPFGIKTLPLSHGVLGNRLGLPARSATAGASLETGRRSAERRRQPGPPDHRGRRTRAAPR